ncbi:MAG: MFS transporter [Christensenellales bacterium]
METGRQKRFTVKEKSWILYDWANSVYATNIMAAIFPTIFVSVAGKGGSYWWGLGTSMATLIIALLSPILGAIADYKGMKKKLFTVFMLTGVLFTALIALTGDWRVMLIGYALSHIGFSGANLFYDSFLTDVTTNDRMDSVSTWGYAMGYIGGSTIPFLLSIGMLLWQGYGSPLAQKFAILITSVWWLGFSIPFLRNVHQEHYIQRPKQRVLGHAFGNVLRTAREIAKNKGLLMFVIAYFFYIDGVGTIISISTAYGTALGLGAVGMILALLVTQIVAMPSSILFGKVSKKISTRRAILFAISVYMLICLVGFIMGYTLEPQQTAFEGVYARASEAKQAGLLDGFLDREGAKTALSDYNKAAQTALLHGKEEDIAGLRFAMKDASAEDLSRAEAVNASLAEDLASLRASAGAEISAYQGAIGRSSIMFWCMAILVGTVQGGIQAVSRSYFGKLVPKDRSNEFFGFFDIFGKFATFVGPLLYTLIGSTTGRASYGTLALLTLFLIGFLVLYRAKGPLSVLEAQALKDA